MKTVLKDIKRTVDNLIITEKEYNEIYFYTSFRFTATV